MEKPKYIRLAKYKVTIVAILTMLWIFYNASIKLDFVPQRSSSTRPLGLVGNEGKEGFSKENLKCATIDKSSRSFPRVFPKGPTSSTPDGYWDLKWNNTVYDAPFVLKPLNVCTRPEAAPEVVLLVFSGVKAVAERHVIRLTYGAYTLVEGRRYTTVFVLGKSPSKDENAEVTLESALYGDILQGDFLDSYRNLTIKNMVAFRWVATECPTSAYVIRITDDVMFSYRKLSKQLDRLEKHGVIFGPMVYYGRIFHAGKYRYSSPIKWKEEAVWSTFIQGTFVMLSMDVVRDIFAVGCKVAPLWPDDTFLALLSEMLNLDVSSRGLYEIDSWMVKNIIKSIKYLNEYTYKRTILYHFVKPNGPALVHFGSSKETPFLMIVLWDLTEKNSVPTQNTQRKACEALCRMSKSKLKRMVLA